MTFVPSANDLGVDGSVSNTSGGSDADNNKGSIAARLGQATLAAGSLATGTFIGKFGCPSLG
jgi:hypothetical protein